MPRLRWMIIINIILLHYYTFTNADCLYEKNFYPEGKQIITDEPCLNCTCKHGILICYLRVCPQIPNPPPIGCILLHRYKNCCPELICTDINNNNNNIEGRSQTDKMHIIKQEQMENACIYNGTIYSPGSAMHTSTSCELCYCLAGQSACIKPKCLLNIDGCQPIYNSTNCCPIGYNCTKNEPITTSTSSTITTNQNNSNKCIVNGTIYEEGSKVMGIGYSICDNCYCIKNYIRCEPILCAPSLLGCKPIIRSNECCPTSYNCSGIIEIEAKLNYGELPTISKEYAKLRKEIVNENQTNKQINLALTTILDGRFNRKVENDSEIDETTTETTEYFNENITEIEITTNDFTTITTILNTTDCKNGTTNENLNKLEFTTINDDNDETTTTTTILDDFSTEYNLKSIETIINLTKIEENLDDYDYNEPTLPPSLPNLKIIPFVAADALEPPEINQDKEDQNNILYPKPDKMVFTNRFSPPIETEGGFIPKENFYENAITIPSIASPSPQPPKLKCHANDQIYIHGQTVTTPESSCLTCNCFYGEIICQKMPCPLPHSNCRKSIIQDMNLCCPQYICDDEEAPTVVLDSNAKEVVTVVDGIFTPDPFRDVIRTEPAPNLQSLIVDMILGHKTTIFPKQNKSTIITTDDMENNENIENITTTTEDILNIDLFKLLSPQTTVKNNVQNMTADIIDTTSAPSSTERANEIEWRKDSNMGVGLLKLAGCNIYGRMYRVGKIITELSNSCLECKCTEVGVKCSPLNC